MAIMLLLGRAASFSGRHPSTIIWSTIRSSRLYSSNNKHKVVFLGTPEVAATTLQQLHAASLSGNNSSSPLFEICTVITQPPKKRRRKQPPEPTPVGYAAQALNLPVWTPLKANDKTFLDDLEQLQPDLCVTAAYGQYLPKRFLNTPTLGTINIHPSLLPKWRGASPVQRSLEHGDDLVGVSLLYTVSAMDAGPLLAQATKHVGDKDTATNVLPQLFALGTDLLLEQLPAIFNGTMTMARAQPQDEAQATTAPLIQRGEGELQPNSMTARTCLNKIRGFSMWPQTFLYVTIDNGDPILVKILQASLSHTTRPVTNVLSDHNKNNKDSCLTLVCHDGSALDIQRLQAATRKACTARDFCNGYPGQTIAWVPNPHA